MTLRSREQLDELVGEEYITKNCFKCWSGDSLKMITDTQCLIITFSAPFFLSSGSVWNK